jgi:hypothetical protein
MKMDLQKLQMILSLIGAIVLGLPAMLHAMVIFFKVIPGDQPDAILEKLLAISEKAADIAGKIYPKAPAPESKE